MTGLKVPDDILAAIKEYDDGIKSDDKRFGRDVLLISDDFSIFLHKNSFVKHISKYYVVFTENYKYTIYDGDYVKVCTQYSGTRSIGSIELKSNMDDF